MKISYKNYELNALQLRGRYRICRLHARIFSGFISFAAGLSRDDRRHSSRRSPDGRARWSSASGTCARRSHRYRVGDHRSVVVIDGSPPPCGAKKIVVPDEHGLDARNPGEARNVVGVEILSRISPPRKTPVPRPTCSRGPWSGRLRSASSRLRVHAIPMSCAQTIRSTFTLPVAASTFTSAIVASSCRQSCCTPAPKPRHSARRRLPAEGLGCCLRTLRISRIRQMPQTNSSGSTPAAAAMMSICDSMANTFMLAARRPPGADGNG